MEKWAEERVDACYRKADEHISGTGLWNYRKHVEDCLREVQDVEWRRLFRDRYVRELVRVITEAGGLDAWLLEAIIDDCHPDGDIDPDLRDCGDRIWGRGW